VTVDDDTGIVLAEWVLADAANGAFEAYVDFTTDAAFDVMVEEFSASAPSALAQGIRFTVLDLTATQRLVPATQQGDGFYAGQFQAQIGNLFGSPVTKLPIWGTNQIASGSPYLGNLPAGSYRLGFVALTGQPSGSYRVRIRPAA
jgi:hypothetical protein